MKKPPRHLHIFGISLLLIVAALAFFLFGVSMEATAPATGVVTSGSTVTLFAAEHGAWEPTGWFAVGETVPAGTVLGSGRTAVIAPEANHRWLIVESLCTPGCAVSAGSPVAVLAPLEADGERLADLRVRLEFEEKHFGEVRPGQEVRLISTMFPPRTHGTATGKIDRLEPTGEAGPNGTRRFHAWVRINHSPFPLRLGSSVKAEVLLGTKLTYQIILEH